jgi:mannose-6-phosphate isomerase-like protein (cupin superfamily)
MMTTVETLRNDPDYFLNLYREGLLELERETPRASETASTSTRDEIRVVAEGFGDFFCDGQIRRVQRGDVLHIGNGSSYRFSDLTDNFSTWVFFYADENSREEDPFRYLQLV